MSGRAAPAPAVRVEPLEAARVGDFWAVHAEANGEGWCCCVAWWVPTWEGWGDRTAAQNRAVREELFAAGQHDGFLLYLDEEPVGWCQCGPRDRLAKLREQMGCAPDPETWAITCFVLAPRARGRGLAHRFLRGVLERLRARGVRRVEAFPKVPPADGGALEPGEVWCGPLAVYEKAGFAVERATEWSLVCALALAP